MHLHDNSGGAADCFNRGAPETQFRYFPDWWSVGSPKPLIDASTPAIAQALGRCLTSRLKLKTTLLGVLPMPSKAFHPRECNWCIYPEAQLREAIGYAAVVAQYDLIRGEYANPAWAAFFAGETPTTRGLTDEQWLEAHRRRADSIYEAQYGAA